tara:strand:- start:845 stop:1246 length:402 start_codon:yes stop_codon:yes gene_type:complete
VGLEEFCRELVSDPARVRALMPVVVAEAATWADGFGEYMRGAEVARWRVSHTFGGVMWPGSDRVVQAPMSAAEVLEELEWLLDGGVPAWRVCEQLGRTGQGLRRLAERYGRHDLARRMRPVELEERQHWRLAS